MRIKNNDTIIWLETADFFGTVLTCVEATYERLENSLISFSEI